eukprot:NODE_1697_length_504_cov_6.151648_g1619_i0.p2 GENE.NODE_1697_length_504_cov_6.151648_g1619_i0~~NODE_1697_length_504_cov_6.151648_g1619_i0.p2  ORF type:complete len:54 (+),score=15.54 NODE_1697_length_504_cov_6.151648_g1619_i0:188-349(+)
MFQCHMRAIAEDCVGTHALRISAMSSAVRSAPPRATQKKKRLIFFVFFQIVFF